MIIMNIFFVLIIGLSFFEFVQSIPYKNSQIMPQVKKVSSEIKIKTVYPNGDVLIDYKDGSSTKADNISAGYKAVYVGLSCDERPNARMLCGFTPYKKNPTKIKSVNWNKMATVKNLILFFKNHKGSL